MTSHKHLFAILITFIAINFISCKKDEEIENASPKLLPVKTVETNPSYSVPEEDYFENTFFLSTGNKYRDTHSVLTYIVESEYDKKSVTQVNKTYKLEDDVVLQQVLKYHYLDKAKGLLDSVIMTDNQYNHFVWHYTYTSDNRLNKIEAYNTYGNLFYMVRYLSYDDNRPINYRYYENYFTDTLNVSCTYDNDKLIQRVYTGFNSHILSKRFQYEYDGKNGAYKNVSTQFTALSRYQNKENFVTKTAVIKYTDMPNDTLRYDRNLYNYNPANYPALKTIENSDKKTEYFYQKN